MEGLAAKVEEMQLELENKSEMIVKMEQMMQEQEATGEETMR